MMLVGLERYLDGSPDAGRTDPAPAAAAEPADTSPRVVKATARPVGDKPAAIAPGGEIDAVITVTIDDGWHLYANPAGAPNLKPTTLALDASSNRSATLASVKYPAGEARILASTGSEKVAMYEGKVEIAARIRLAETVKPGPLRLVLRLNYQACNDRLCLAPARLEVPLEVQVAR